MSNIMIYKDATEEQAAAWMAVVQTLNEVCPGWIARDKNGMDSACIAIRKLALPASAPEGVRVPQWLATTTLEALEWMHQRLQDETPFTSQNAAVIHALLRDWRVIAKAPPADSVKALPADAYVQELHRAEALRIADRLETPEDHSRALFESAAITLRAYAAAPLPSEPAAAEADADDLERMRAANQWHNLQDIVPTLKAAKAGEWHWYENPKCKYIEVRIDMRDLGCIVMNRDRERITPAMLAQQWSKENKS